MHSRRSSQDQEIDHSDELAGLKREIFLAAIVDEMHPPPRGPLFTFEESA